MAVAITASDQVAGAAASMVDNSSHHLETIGLAWFVKLLIGIEVILSDVALALVVHHDLTVNNSRRSRRRVGRQSRRDELLMSGAVAPYHPVLDFSPLVPDPPDRPERLRRLIRVHMENYVSLGFRPIWFM